MPIQTLAKVDFTLLPTKLKNSEKFIDVRRHLIKSMKNIMSITKTNSIIREVKTYKQVISEPIHAKQ